VDLPVLRFLYALHAAIVAGSLVPAVPEPAGPPPSVLRHCSLVWRSAATLFFC
jgi:hypothetical protein